MKKSFLNIFFLFLLISIAAPNKPDIAGNKINRYFGNDSPEIKGKGVIDNYITAIGGRNRISSIIDRTTYITGKVRNMNINITVYQKSPNLYFQKTELGAAEQKIIFDGKKGIMITGDNTQEIKGAELEKLKYEATMQLLLYLKAYDVKAEFKGIEKANGVEAYKVILKLPGDMNWTQYYDTSTYFKSKRRKTGNSRGRRSNSAGIFFQ